MLADDPGAPVVTVPAVRREAFAAFVAEVAAADAEFAAAVAEFPAVVAEPAAAVAEFAAAVAEAAAAVFDANAPPASALYWPSVSASVSSTAVPMLRMR